MAQQMPPDLGEALAAHEPARLAFEALPPARQAEWVSWVGRARSRRGRDRRIQETIQRLGGWTPAVAADTVVEEPEAPPPPPPREWWPWLALLALLVIAGLLALYFLTRDNGNKRAVPSVVGLQEQQAVRRLNDRGLTARVTRRPSGRPHGQVFGQDPRAGTKLSKGDRVQIAVSSAPVQVAVPDVVGLTADDANTRLVSAGLVPDEHSVFSAKKPGVVVAQDPSAGSKVKKAQTVAFNVSRGRGTTPIPSVIGNDQATAIKKLRSAELTPKVAEVPSAQPKGTVVAQAPAPGGKVPKGTTVRINVSNGSGGGTTTSTTTTATTTTVATTTTATTTAPPPATATVPDVTGQDHTSAIRQLLAAGLKPRVVYVHSDQPDNTVTDESPAAGTSVRGGSRVRIDISAGPTPTYTTVPNVLGKDEATARRTLRAAGFQVAVFRVAGKHGFVVDEQPTSGGRAPSNGGQVDIFVGR